MRRALVFAHYDPHGVVDDHVLYALAVYRQHFELVHFVSTAALDAAQVARAAGLADRVMVRENVGYDFLSWKAGFAALPRHLRFDAVVFANDSCYGPVSDMEAFWRAVEGLGADLWGASLNRQFSPHVQSFFMGFGRRLLETGFAHRFWDGVRVIEDKLAMIAAYEIGLSRAVVAEGFTIGGVASLAPMGPGLRARLIADNASESDAIAAGRAAAVLRWRRLVNPAHLGWAESLRMGSPLVKVELLRDNPLRANIGRLYEQLRAGRRYDVALIGRHLERTAGATALPPPVRTNAGVGRGGASGGVGGA